MVQPMRPIKVGFMTCVHPYYDLPDVMLHRDLAVRGLTAAGCEVLTAPIARTPADAAAAASEFRAQGVNAVLLFFCTWVDEEITLALARETAHIPMVLWGLPYLDKDIPMPSPISGLTSSGSNIRLLGKPFTYLVGNVTPAKIEEAVKQLRAAEAAAGLRGARFGVVGDPCPGMLDVQADELAFENGLGITTIHLELNALLNLAGKASPDAASAAAARLEVCGQMTPELTTAALATNTRLYLAMKELLERHRLDAYCVRCWPELRNDHKLTMCAAHALLSQDGVPNSCEVDLPALITTYVLNRIAGTPAFSFDLTAVFEDEDAVQLAHCGAADPSLASGPSAVLLRTHMRTGTGATVEFPFKEGEVTLAKILRPRDGRLRMFAARAEVIPSGPARGSVATVKPKPSAAAFLDAVMREPIEHHVALVYGDWMQALAGFCEFTGTSFAPLAESL
jgi:L-fucose isomerase-like protein